jgi:cell fate (sporulation/competence/biofilm development) regulator YlbF (YheA/YmcA/DUF963 family)
MEEILKKANELGLLIKGSELYRRFNELSSMLDSNPQAKALLDEYIEYSGTVLMKEEQGAPVEVAEKQKLEEIGKKVTENDLIKEYIATQTYFFNLLTQVQNIINNPQGEPIPESKILKPGSSGGIITDF